MIRETSSNFIYVDNSNLYIEGQRVSAVSKGWSPSVDEATRNETFDYSFRINCRALYNIIRGRDPRSIRRAVVFASQSQNNELVLNNYYQVGFEVLVETPNAESREKKIDVSIATEMLWDAHVAGNTGTKFILVSGDGDYVPAIKKLVGHGFEVEVMFWEHASGELKRVCSKFTSLNPYLHNLSLPHPPCRYPMTGLRPPTRWGRDDSTNRLV